MKTAIALFFALSVGIAHASHPDRERPSIRLVEPGPSIDWCCHDLGDLEVCGPCGGVIHCDFGSQKDW
ncbi:MAG: hypothetical protein AB8B48_04335 [Pseudomonadales bacterium]